MIRDSPSVTPGKLHKQDSTSRLLNLMRNSGIQTIALPCANFDPASPVTARPHQNPRRSPTDDSGVATGSRTAGRDIRTGPTSAASREAEV